MKSTRKFISVLLVVMMLISCVTASFSVNASTGVLSDYYATNPDNKVGVKKTITIDGDFSDWSSDMLIAQGAAWDVANHYKGGHENCVLDTYALFAAWDDDNLYVAWQMVNTTDTWAREGDGPLSDGGRVLDVPLILALSIDPNSVSMSNKNTSGSPIWGQKMGLSFDQHVDRLLYMSGKPGNGTPGMFSAVDAEGNTDYNEGLQTFAQSGIEYKMAEGNVCDNIYGLNYSEDPNDVYSNDADWVDYKTFKGAQGTHDTKYDSFYEIKIPFSALGIDADYVETNGIGAMLIATRGESGLDCVPFDDTMLDNALESYGSDASTSHEKDDEDVITSPFARIGSLNGGGDVQPTTQPVTQPTTVQPTTVQPTTQPTTAPVSDTLTVNAKSNLFTNGVVEADSSANTVTVTYDLRSSMKIVNGQWELTYDPSKLKLVTESHELMPYISDGVVSVTASTAKGNFTNATSLYDFTSSKPLVQAVFEIVGTGSTDVTLDVKELSVGYKANDALCYENAVVNSIIRDISNIAGFESSSISGKAYVVTDEQPTETEPTTQPASEEPTTKPTVSDDKITINATSNFFPEVSKTYSKDEKQVTVSYKLSSSINLVNSEWVLSYDTAKLSFDKANISNVMPNVSNAVINEGTKGSIKGNFTNLSSVNFNKETEFVTVTFNVIGTGSADVDLYVNVLGIGFRENLDSQVNIQYLVDFGVIKDVTSASGFENEIYTTSTQITSGNGESETDPTQPSKTLKVNATSNILSPVSKEFSADNSTVTVTYRLESSSKLINSQWVLTYDSSKLYYDVKKNAGTLMPNISSFVANEPVKGEIRGAFTNTALYDFSTEKDFIKVTFDIIGQGEANVDLNIEILGVAYKDQNMLPVVAYPVDFSILQDITGIKGFENYKLSGKIIVDTDESQNVLYGDVNNDGIIDITDATMIQKYIVGIEKFTDDQFKRADVNFDGSIDVSDATLISKYIVGIVNSFQ